MEMNSRVTSSIKDFTRLQRFLEECNSRTTVQQVNNGLFYLSREKLIIQGINEIKDRLPKNARVLDVGCGTGPALEKFREQGWDATGITVNHKEKEITDKEGYDVRIMDMSFLEFEDETFDLVWARHCLEHSLFPYFTLHGLARVMKKGALIYVEVPAPTEDGHQENNKEHFSVFGVNMWVSLMHRVGIVKISVSKIKVKNGSAVDYFYNFIATKN